MPDSTGSWQPPFFGTLIALLATIAARVDWKKLRSKNPVDVWNHRIRAATSCRDISEFTSKLCNYFGLQSLPESTIALIEELESTRDDVLEYVRSRHIAVGTISYSERVKLWKKRESKEESQS